jgi:hypothetical protein
MEDRVSPVHGGLLQEGEGPPGRTGLRGRFRVSQGVNCRAADRSRRVARSASYGMRTVKVNGDEALKSSADTSM